MSGIAMQRVWMIHIFVILFSDLAFSHVQEVMEDGKSNLAKLEARRFAKILYADAQQTENQANYDVRYYDIYLDIDPELELIDGHVDIDADVVGDAMDRLDVNLLDNMVVDSVIVLNQAVGFTHINHLVTVLLDRTYDTGEKVRVRIYYHGNPTQSGFGAFGFDTYSGQPMIWSLSEPFGARNWWPCKDIPEDKADSVDIRITVPANLIVASNGLLRSVTGVNDKKMVWWHEKYPIVSYLVSVAIHPYSIFSDSVEVVPGSKMPIDYYVFSDQLERAKRDYAKTKEMIEAFSTLFGPYPFHEEKYGHAQFLGGAYMEHQTISSLRKNVGQYTVAHELAHQWWGDLITCRDFGHIWLNEGFATYSEALWAEFAYGEEAYWAIINSKKYFGEGTIFVTQMDVSHIFSGNLSYNKASWVLHMLRHVVGDETFFHILQSYASDPRFKYGTATTEDFKQVCEEIFDRDLDDFFHQWIYEEYFPQYQFHYNVRDSSGFFVTEVNVKQMQTNTVMFHMPIDLFFGFDNGDTTIVVDNDQADQTYCFVFDRPPELVRLDHGDWILKTVTESHTKVAYPAHGSFPVDAISGFPNPFNDQVRICLELSKTGNVTVEVFNLLGQRVNVIHEGKLTRGKYYYIWKGDDSVGNRLPTGIYFCRFEYPNMRKIIKIIKSR